MNNNHSKFERKEFNPAALKRIQVFHHGSWISGFKFFDRNNQILLEYVYRSVDKITEIVLQDGEQLLGVRSQRWAQSDEDSLAHCNLTLIFGFQE